MVFSVSTKQQKISVTFGSHNPFRAEFHPLFLASSMLLKIFEFQKINDVYCNASISAKIASLNVETALHDLHFSNC